VRVPETFPQAPVEIQVPQQRRNTPTSPSPVAEPPKPSVILTDETISDIQATLKESGFLDTNTNRRLILECNGDIGEIFDRLLIE
jgi:hypothetical protein